MNWTLCVVRIPASNDVLLLIGIFLNPCHFGGGGSLSPEPFYYAGAVTCFTTRCLFHAMPHPHNYKPWDTTQALQLVLAWR